MTPSLLAWRAAGCPPHNYKTRAGDFICATCATTTDTAVALAEIETPTMADHANVFRFSRDGVCEGCAWLFQAGKGRPGNYLATPERMEYLVISLESIVEDKRPWITALQELATMPAETPVAGVMTTDVKPRLFPRTKMATVGRFGLFVHCMDYDHSAFVEFDLRECLEIIGLMIPALTLGFAKASLYHGLFRDFQRSSKALDQAMSIEAGLARVRNTPAFLPALIAAGITKETKEDVKGDRPAGNTHASTTSRDQADQAQLGLF